MRHKTQLYLDAWLWNHDAWNVWTLSRPEREEMTTDISLYHASDLRWQWNRRYWLERQREDRLWAEQFKMKKLLQEEQEREKKLLQEEQERENQKLNRDYWARQEAWELQQQQELRQRKQIELLDKKLRKQLELRQEQRELMENKRLLCKLRDKDPDKLEPEPPKYSRLTAPAPRAPRKVLPFTGSMPKVL
jgi:septal ring factor EnvC (AmiA/AmiB activator)